MPSLSASALDYAAANGYLATVDETAFTQLPVFDHEARLRATYAGGDVCTGGMIGIGRETAELPIQSDCPPQGRAEPFWLDHPSQLRCG